jgi:hypothetical protein
MGVGGVGHDAGASVYPGGVESCLDESGLHDSAGQAFAEAEEMILQARRESPGCGDVLQDLGKLLKVGFELGEEWFGGGWTDRVEDDLEVALAQVLESLVGGRKLAASGGLAHLEELVGDIGERADNHDRSVVEAQLNDLSRAADGSGVFD